MPNNPNGVAAFPPNMADGNYDVVVTVSSASIAAAKKHVAAVKDENARTASKGATFTFHIVIRTRTSSRPGVARRRLW